MTAYFTYSLRYFICILLWKLLGLFRQYQSLLNEGSCDFRLSTFSTALYSWLWESVATKNALSMYQFWSKRNLKFLFFENNSFEYNQHSGKSCFSFSVQWTLKIFQLKGYQTRRLLALRFSGFLNANTRKKIFLIKLTNITNYTKLHMRRKSR